jgi:hypothetical protein
MYNTCHQCEVAWTGDSPCWVCGREAQEGGPHITVTAGAQRWRFEEGDRPDLALATRRRAPRLSTPWTFPIAS